MKGDLRPHNTNASTRGLPISPRYDQNGIPVANCWVGLLDSFLPGIRGPNVKLHSGGPLGAQDDQAIPFMNSPSGLHRPLNSRILSPTERMSSSVSSWYIERLSTSWLTASATGYAPSVYPNILR